MTSERMAAEMTERDVDMERWFAEVDIEATIVARCCRYCRRNKYPERELCLLYLTVAPARFMG